MTCAVMWSWWSRTEWVFIFLVTCLLAKQANGFCRADPLGCKGELGEMWRAPREPSHPYYLPVCLPAGSCFLADNKSPGDSETVKHWSLPFVSWAGRFHPLPRPVCNGRGDVTGVSQSTSRAALPAPTSFPQTTFWGRKTCSAHPFPFFFHCSL